MYIHIETGYKETFRVFSKDEEGCIPAEEKGEKSKRKRKKGGSKKKADSDEPVRRSERLSPVEKVSSNIL